MYKWKVVPLCKEQLLDITPEDVIPGGVFRLCDVYKSGGGYDKFPEICEKRLGIKTNPKQFVTQLYGCHLNCSYCYITPNGIWGSHVKYTSEELVQEFKKTDCDVFHLMGGAPALYIEYWLELIGMLDNYGGGTFHSDLTLTEKKFNRPLLKAISQPNCLYAVNVKGVTPDDYKKNTGKEFDSSMFWINLYDLMICDVPFYITFTNPDMNHYDEYCDFLRQRFGNNILEDSFIINLKEYDAVKAYKEKENGR